MPVLVLDIPVLAVFALELPMITEIQQGVHVPVHLKDDIGATAAIATGGAALRHKFLPAECRFPMTAIPRLDDDLRPIDELHDPFLSKFPQDVEKAGIACAMPAPNTTIPAPSRRQRRHDNPNYTACCSSSV